MQIRKVYLNKDNLLKIEKIDDSFYTNAITGIDWYLERYTDKHCGYFLVNDFEEVVGYIASVPIKKELYDAIVNGVLLNDLHVNPKMICTKSDYNYLVSCVIKEEYRHKKYGSILLETLLKDIEGYICCLTISKDGYNLVSKHMDLKEKLDSSVSIFIKEKRG